MSWRVRDARLGSLAAIVLASTAAHAAVRVGDRGAPDDAEACAVDAASGARHGAWSARTRVCTLLADVEVSGTMTVDADRLTLDCANHTLRGAAGGPPARLEIVGRTQVTVRDCVLEDVAVRVVASRDVAVVRNQIASAFEGIAAHATSLLRISDNQLAGGAGITLTLVDKALVRDNRIDHPFTGLLALGVTRASIAGNTVADAAGVAIALAYSRDNGVRGNLVERCGSRGVELSFASDNLVTGNRVTGCADAVYGRRSGAGLALSGARRNRIVDNTITGNQVGVLFGGDANLWSKNTVTGSLVDDLVIADGFALGCANEIAADNHIGDGPPPLIVTRDHQLLSGGRYSDVLVCGARGVVLSGVQVESLALHGASLFVVRGSVIGKLSLSGSEVGLVADNQLGRSASRPDRVEVRAGGSRFVTFAGNTPEPTVTSCATCIVAAALGSGRQLATRCPPGCD